MDYIAQFRVMNREAVIDGDLRPAISLLSSCVLYCA